MGVLEHRVTRLERRRQREPGRAVPAQLIVCEPDESTEAAIFRICGEAGLPPRAPRDGPHLILQAVRPAVDRFAAVVCEPVPPATRN
jgi:hypothetical protein